jgi:hypothetical protein
MSLLLEHPVLEPLVVDDAAAPRTLREQIARLDEELGALGAALPAPRHGRGASFLGIEQLERIRDSLAARAADVRAELGERGRLEEEARRSREELLLDPAAHPFARVENEDVGEPGCCDWHVRPRFGLLGMLAGWWRVVVSSGCPLAGARYLWPRDRRR